MPWRWLGVVGLLVAPSVAACGDDSDDAGVSTATSTVPSLSAEELCQDAADTLGALDPPTDVVGVRNGADAIAARAVSEEMQAADLDPPLADALSSVAVAARLLSDAAIVNDTAGMVDAAATLTTAYDELDEVAADLRLGVCTSESWGRQVVIAALDLTGAGG